jgi:hypothetical protein
MATENDLQQAMSDFRESTQSMKEAVDYGKFNLKGFGEELLGTAKTVKDAREKFGENLAKAGKQAAGAMGSLASSLSKSQTNFTQLNAVVDIAANALSGMVKAIPFAGEALAAGIQATAAASKFMLDQMDQTSQAFNKLSAVGALTVEGMTGLQEQFTASQLSFAAFQKQVTENAQALARFKGMAGDGADAFSEITGTLTDLSDKGDDSLRRLGMSTDDIGASTAAFITQQTRLGLAQGRSSAELAAGTKAYAIELDALQKVTGMSREAIQKQQDAALSESRFRANYDELIAQGKEKEAAALMKLQTQISAIGPEAGQGVRDLLSGAGTDAAAKLMASTGGAAQDILNRVKAGKLDETQAALELQQAMKKTAEAARNNAKYVDKGSSAFLDYAQQSDFINAQIVDGQLIKQRQDKQMAAGQDKLTDQTIDAQKAMQKMGNEFTLLGFKFLPKASAAVEVMTETMLEFVDFVNRKIGVKTDVTPEQKQADEIAKKTARILADKNATPEQKQQAEQEEIAAAARARQANLEALNRRRAARRSGGAPSSQGDAVVGSDQSRASVEQYLGKKISDTEFSALIKATHAEAAGGKQANQQEQAMIMASILNRARTDKGGITGALDAVGQFQSVTGTYNKLTDSWSGPSEHYLKGPQGDRLKSIEGAATLLSGISRDQKNFTAADSKAYGPGTTIKYRDDMLAKGGTVIGGTVFETKAPGAPAISAAPSAPAATAGAPKLTGPTSSYQSQSPAAQSREELISKPPPTAVQPSANAFADNAMLTTLVAKQDELITVMKNQLAVQQKQLQLSN